MPSSGGDGSAGRRRGLQPGCATEVPGIGVRGVRQVRWTQFPPDLPDYGRVAAAARLADRRLWQVASVRRRPAIGPQAVRLDRLLNRDGLTVDEAIQVASRAPEAAPEHVLRLIADRLPRRRRHVVVPDDVLQLVAREFPDPIEARERAVKARRTRLALGQAFNQLKPEERRLMSLRFRQSLTVREIAGILNVDARRLYRTFDRLVGKLRRDMGTFGVTDLTFPC